MNHKKIALFAFLILLFAAGFALWQMRPRPTTVRLDMKGTEGIKVADTITVDGIQRIAADQHHRQGAELSIHNHDAGAPRRDERQDYGWRWLVLQRQRRQRFQRGAGPFLTLVAREKRLCHHRTKDPVNDRSLPRFK